LWEKKTFKQWCDVQWLRWEMVIGFCGYWWYCWPSLFKRFFFSQYNLTDILDWDKGNLFYKTICMDSKHRLLESQPYPKILFQRSEYFLDRDRIVVGFTTTYANSVYHHKSCEFESRSWNIVCKRYIWQKKILNLFFDLL
jgi:hypothetical protein